MGIVTGTGKCSGKDLTNSIITRSASSNILNDKNKETVVVSDSSNDSGSECECNEDCTCDGVITVSDSSDEVGEASSSQSLDQSEPNHVASSKERLNLLQSKESVQQQHPILCPNLSSTPRRSRNVSLCQVGCHKSELENGEDSFEVGSVLTGSEETCKDICLIDVETNPEKRWAKINNQVMVALETDDEMPDKTNNLCYIPFISDNFIEDCGKFPKNSDQECIANSLFGQNLILNCNKAQDAKFEALDPELDGKFNLLPPKVSNIDSTLFSAQSSSSKSDSKICNTNVLESFRLPTPISAVEYELLFRMSSDGGHPGSSLSTGFETRETKRKLYQTLERKNEFPEKSINEQEQSSSLRNNAAEHGIDYCDTYEFTESDDPSESITRYSYYTREFKSIQDKQNSFISYSKSKPSPMDSRDSDRPSGTFTRNRASVRCYAGKSPPSSKSYIKTEGTGSLMTYSKTNLSSGILEEKVFEGKVGAENSKGALSSHKLLQHKTSECQKDQSQRLTISQPNYNFQNTFLDVAQGHNHKKNTFPVFDVRQEESMMVFNNDQETSLEYKKSHSRTLACVPNKLGENVAISSNLPLPSSEQPITASKLQPMTHESDKSISSQQLQLMTHDGDKTTSTSQHVNKADTPITTVKELVKQRSGLPQHCLQELHTSTASPELFDVVNGDVTVNEQKKLFLEGEKITIDDLLQYIDDENCKLQMDAMSKRKSSPKLSVPNEPNIKNETANNNSPSSLQINLLHSGVPPLGNSFGVQSLEMDHENRSSVTIEMCNNMNGTRASVLHHGLKTCTSINLPIHSAKNVHSIDGALTSESMSMPSSMVDADNLTDGAGTENISALTKNLNSHQSSSPNTFKTIQNVSAATSSSSMSHTGNSIPCNTNLQSRGACSNAPESEHCDGHLDSETASNSTDDGVIGEIVSPVININLEQHKGCSTTSMDGENKASLVPDPDFDGVVLYCHGAVLCSQARVRPDGFTLYHVFERFEEGCGCCYYPSAQQIVDSDKPLQTMIDKVLSETTGECSCECSQKDAPALDPKEALRQELDGVQVYRSKKLHGLLAWSPTHQDRQSASQEDESMMNNSELTNMENPLSYQECNQTNNRSSKEDDFAYYVKDAMHAIPSLVETSPSHVSFHKESNEKDKCLLSNVSNSCRRAGSPFENDLKTKLMHKNVSEELVPSKMNAPSCIDVDPLCDKSVCTVTYSEHSKTQCLSAMPSSTGSNLTINRTRASLRSFQGSRSQSDESNSNKESYEQSSSKTLPAEVRNSHSSLDSESTAPPSLPTGPSSLGQQYFVLPVAQHGKVEATQSVGDFCNEHTHDQKVAGGSDTCFESVEKAKNMLKSISNSDTRECDCSAAFKCIPNPERSNVPPVNEDTQHPSPPLYDEDQQYHECPDANLPDVDKITAQTGSSCSTQSSYENFPANFGQNIDSRGRQGLPDMCCSDTEAAWHCNSEAKHLACGAWICGPVSNTSFFRLPEMADDHRSCSSRFQLYQFKLRFPSMGGCQSVRWRRVMRRMRKLSAVISIDAEEENNKLIVILHVTLAAAITVQDGEESLTSVSDKVLLPDVTDDMTLVKLKAEEELAVVMRQDDYQHDEAKSCKYFQNKTTLLSEQAAEFNAFNSDNECTADQACNREEADQQRFFELDETAKVRQTHELCETEDDQINKQVKADQEQIQPETRVQHPGQELVGYGMENETAIELSRFSGNDAAELNVMCSYSTEENIGLDAHTSSKDSSSIQDDVNCWDEEDFNFDDEVYCRVSVQSEDGYFSKQNPSKNEKEEDIEESNANWYESMKVNVLNNSSAKVLTKKKQKKAPFNSIFCLLKKIDNNVSLEVTYEVQLPDDKYKEEIPASCCEQETNWARHLQQERYTDLNGAAEYMELMDRESGEAPNLIALEKNEAHDKKFYGAASSRFDEIKFALPKDSGGVMMCVCDCVDCMEDDFKDNPGNDTRCYCEVTRFDCIVCDIIAADCMERATFRDTLNKVVISDKNIPGTECDMFELEGEKSNLLKCEEESKSPGTTEITRKSECGKMCRIDKACASAHCIYKKKDIFNHIAVKDIIPLLWCSEGHRVYIRGPVPGDTSFTEGDQEMEGSSRNDINTTSRGERAKRSSKKKDSATAVMKAGKMKAKTVDSSKVAKKVQIKVSLPKDNKDMRKKGTKRCINVSCIKKQKITKFPVKKNPAQVKGRNDLITKKTNESSNNKKRVGTNSKRTEKKKTAQKQPRQTKKSLASEEALSQKRRPAHSSTLSNKSTSTPGQVSSERSNEVAVDEPTACTLNLNSSTKLISASDSGTLCPDHSIYARLSSNNQCNGPIHNALDSKECSVANVVLGCSNMDCKDKSGQSDLEDLDALPSLEDEPDKFSRVLDSENILSKKSCSFVDTTPNKDGNDAIGMYNAAELLCPDPTLDTINEFPLLKQSRVSSPLKQQLRAAVLREQASEQVLNKQASNKAKAKFIKNKATTSTVTRSRRRNKTTSLPQNKFIGNLDADHVSCVSQASTNSKQLDCVESTNINYPTAENEIQEQNLVCPAVLSLTAYADDRACSQETNVQSIPESVRELHRESSLNDEYLKLSSVKYGLPKDNPAYCDGGSDKNQGTAEKCLFNEDCSTELEICRNYPAVEVVKNISSNNHTGFHKNHTNTVNNEVPSCNGRTKRKTVRSAKFQKRLRSEKSSSDTSEYIPDGVSSEESRDEDARADCWSLHPRDIEITSSQAADCPELGKTRRRQVKAFKKDFAYHFDDEYNQEDGGSSGNGADFVPAERDKSETSSARDTPSKGHRSTAGRMQTRKKKKLANRTTGHKEINLGKRSLHNFRKSAFGENLHLGGGCLLYEGLLSLQGPTALAAENSARGMVTKRKCGVHMTARERTVRRRLGKCPMALDKVVNQTNYSNNCLKMTSDVNDMVSDTNKSHLLVSSPQSVQSHILSSEIPLNQLANIKSKEISDCDLEPPSMLEGRESFDVGRIKEEPILSIAASALNYRNMSCSDNGDHVFTKETSDNIGNRLLSNDPTCISELISVAKSKGIKPSGLFESEQCEKTYLDGSCLVVGRQQERGMTSKVDVPHPATPVKEEAGTTKTPAGSMIKGELAARTDIIGDISDFIDIDSSSNSSNNSNNNWNMKSGTTFSDVYFKFIRETSKDNREKNDSNDDIVDVSATLSHRGLEDASAASLQAMVSAQEASVMVGVSVQEASVTAGVCAVKASVRAGVDASEDTKGACEEVLQDPLSLANDQCVINIDDSDDESHSWPVIELPESNSPVTFSVASDAESSSPIKQSFAWNVSPVKNEFPGFSDFGTVHPLLITLNSNQSSQMGIGYSQAARYQRLSPVGGTTNHGSSTYNSLYSSSVCPLIKNRQFARSSDLTRYRSILPKPKASLPKPIVLQSGLARARVQRKEARKTYDQITCVRLFEADSDISSVGSGVHKVCKRKLASARSERPRLSSEVRMSNLSPKLAESLANIRLKEARVNVDLWTKAHVDKIISESCSSSSSDEYLQQKSIHNTNDPKLKQNAKLLVERVDLACVKRKYGVTLSDYYLQRPAKKSRGYCNTDGCLLCSDVCCCEATSAVM